jgi:hypothetical protein
MKRIRGIVVGRERVCEDDASAQTMFERATRGWGHCRPRIQLLFAGQSACKKRQNWYLYNAQDELYHKIESRFCIDSVRGRKLQRLKVLVENVIASPGPEGATVGRTRPRLCTCFFNRVSMLHK